MGTIWSQLLIETKTELLYIVSHKNTKDPVLFISLPNVDRYSKFFTDVLKKFGTTLCLKKNIPDIFDCNLKNNYQILIIFRMNIPDTICDQVTV